MVSDRFKTAFVTICYAICLGTLFTSPTITFGGKGSLPSLTPKTQLHCRGPQMALQQCQTDCESLRIAVKTCEKVVRKAYRHVNLGGCPLELKAWTLCESEWCQNGMDGRMCLSECGAVKENLETCKTNVVESFLYHHRLEKDESLKDT